MLNVLYYTTGTQLDNNAIFSTYLLSTSSSSLSRDNYTENFSRTYYQDKTLTRYFETGNTINLTWYEQLWGVGYASHLGYDIAVKMNTGLSIFSGIEFATGANETSASEVFSGLYSNYTYFSTNSKLDIYYFDDPGDPWPCSPAATVQDVLYTRQDVNTGTNITKNYLGQYTSYYTAIEYATGGAYGTQTGASNFIFKTGVSYTYRYFTSVPPNFRTSTVYSLEFATKQVTVPITTQFNSTDIKFTYSKIINKTTGQNIGLFGSPPYVTVIGKIKENQSGTFSGLYPNSYYSLLKEEDGWLFTSRAKYKRLDEIGAKITDSKTEFSFYPVTYSMDNYQLYTGFTNTRALTQDVRTLNIFSNIPLTYHSSSGIDRILTLTTVNTGFMSAQTGYLSYLYGAANMPGIPSGTLTYLAHDIEYFQVTCQPPLSGFWSDKNPILSLTVDSGNTTREFFTLITTGTYSYTSTKIIPATSGYIKNQIPFFRGTDFRFEYIPSLSVYVTYRNSINNYLTSLTTTFTSTGENWYKTTNNDKSISFSETSRATGYSYSGNTLLTTNCQKAIYIFAYSTYIFSAPWTTFSVIFPTATLDTYISNYTVSYLSNNVINENSAFEFNATRNIYYTRINNGYSYNSTVNDFRGNPPANLNYFNTAENPGFNQFINNTGHRKFRNYLVTVTGNPDYYTGIGYINFTNYGYAAGRGVLFQRFPDIMVMPFYSVMSSTKNVGFADKNINLTLYPIYNNSGTTGVEYQSIQTSTNAPWTFLTGKTFVSGLLPPRYYSGDGYTVVKFNMLYAYPQSYTYTGAGGGGSAGGGAGNLVGYYTNTYLASGTIQLNDEISPNEPTGYFASTNLLSSKVADNAVGFTFINDKNTTFNNFINNLSVLSATNNSIYTSGILFLGNQQIFHIITPSGDKSYYTIKEPFVSGTLLNMGFASSNEAYEFSTTEKSTTTIISERSYVSYAPVPLIAKDKYYFTYQ